MLQFLQPIWLLAAGAIIVPLVIHLWNIRQGKILKVGSIQLLARNAQQRASSLRITEKFLLFLRCLLLILLAMLLAQPYWETSKQKGWILIEKQDVPKAYKHFKTEIDSLLNAGYTFHFFEKGFREGDLSAMVKDSGSVNNVPQLSYWQLIRLLDKQLVKQTPVYLYTNNRQNRFADERAETAMHIKWQTFTNADSTHQFIAYAYLRDDDSVQVITGRSNPSQTIYQTGSFATNLPKQGAITLDVSDGDLSVAYLNGQPVKVDTTVLRVGLYADVFVNDLHYVQAAIQSIKDVKKKRIDVTVITDASKIPGNQDWLFWLSDLPVPVDVRAKNIFYYQKGDKRFVHSNIFTGDNHLNEPVLYQRVDYAKNNAGIVWKDGTGLPLLTKKIDGAQAGYSFYSHIDPAWNDLPWSSSFPTLLYDLISPDRKDLSDSNDYRIIAAAQIQLPVKNDPSDNTISSTIDTSSTKHIFWLIIFIIFCIERFFSYRIKKESSYA